MSGLREPWMRRLAAVVAFCVALVLVLFAAGGSSRADASQASTLRSWSGRTWVLQDGLGSAADAATPQPLSATAASDAAAAAAVDAFFAQGGEIVGFIFYGRRRYTAIQWPYLLQSRRRAGVSSAGGGVLSRVIFVANTENAEDLDYVEDLRAANAEFVTIQHPDRVAKQGQNNADYCSLYAAAGTSSGKTLVIKIDDDLLYIAPMALRNLVAAKLGSEHLFVSANVVNHPLLAHVHQRLGLYDAAAVDRMTEAELARNQTDVDRLPSEWRFDYTTFSGDGWQSGPHAMLQHVMLLDRLRSLGDAGATAVYGSFRQWDFDAMGYNTGRWSINCFVYDPSDLAALDVNDCRAIDDEHYLTNVFPERMHRHCVAAGNSLVAHFAYYPQREWLEANSAVLGRYAELSRQLQERIMRGAGELP